MNNNGSRVLELCARRRLLVGNSFFQHADNHSATWVHAGTGAWAAIDLILVDTRLRSSLRDVRAMPAVTSHRSDHRLVVADVQLRLRAQRHGGSSKPARPDIARLRGDNDAQAAFQASIRGAHERWQQQQQGGNTAVASDADAQLAALTSAVLEAAPAAARPGKQRPWLSPNTLRLTARKQLPSKRCSGFC